MRSQRRAASVLPGSSGAYGSAFTSPVALGQPSHPSTQRAAWRYCPEDSRLNIVHAALVGPPRTAALPPDRATFCLEASGVGAYLGRHGRREIGGCANGESIVGPAARVSIR